MQLSVLSKKEIETIHGEALKVLHQAGMHVMDEESRNMLKGAGCWEKEDGNICYPEELIHKALEKIPNRIVLYDREGNLRVDTRDKVNHYAPGLNCIYIHDYRTGEHRECTLADCREAARVSDALPNIDCAGGLGNPADVPPEKQGLETVKAIMAESKKPFLFIAHNEVEDEEIWEHIAQVAGGWDKLAEKPFALDMTGPYSPLELGEEACRRMRHAARRHVPVVCYPAYLPGAAGPSTYAGSLVQSSAEILGGLVVHQLEEPGAPVITGSAILPMDLRTGYAVAYGSPEQILGGIADVDYFNYLGVPCWIGAGCSDAYTLDAQAAGEAAAGMALASLSGTSFIKNLGYLIGGKSGSLELLTFTDELIGMERRINRGIPTDQDHLATDVILRAAKKNTFMEDDHTIAHMRETMWHPGLFERHTIQEWRQLEMKTAQERIRERLREILEG